MLFSSNTCGDINRVLWPVDSTKANSNCSVFRTSGLVSANQVKFGCRLVFLVAHPGGPLLYRSIQYMPGSCLLPLVSLAGTMSPRPSAPLLVPGSGDCRDNRYSNVIGALCFRKYWANEQRGCFNHDAFLVNRCSDCAWPNSLGNLVPTPSLHGFAPNTLPSLAKSLLSPVEVETARMSQALRINHDDPQVGYDGEWSQDVNFAFTSSSATLGVPNAFYILFRGTVDTQWAH